MKVLTWACLILFLLVTQGLQSQTIDAPEDMPTWILLEKGKEYYEKKDFGSSLRMYRAVLERKEYIPEAFMGIASIYEEEGEYDLAEKNYLQALAEEKNLYIPEDSFLLRYRLAAIYEQTKQYGKYEDLLHRIIASDELTLEKIALRNAMVRNLKESGIDKLVELYRLEIPQYRSAYAALGQFYYRTGRYEESIEHFTLALLHSLSTCINGIAQKEPLYTVSTVEELLLRCKREERILGYLERINFFRDLYYAAGSLYAVGEYESADELWLLIQRHSSERSLVLKAAEQLRSPFIEPIVTLSP
ncbi:MAG: hypothetical protein JW760_10795 [Spirochaetales bacterium]|nr:hypothetical protein [Spirochaetales bacterium]